MQRLADEAQFLSLVDDLAADVRRAIDGSGGPSKWAIVGVRSRGDVLAHRLAAKLGLTDRVGSLDITLYRDDLSEIGSQAVVQTTEIDFDIDGLNVLLVDDVLMTGRSIRAALQSLLDIGRPCRVWLAVLVDRGGRELPIAPDFVGLVLSAKPDQLPPGSRVDVTIKPTDAQDAITVRPSNGREAAR
jgi:pyrimidine operon attenuation protein/uracil phosphoribosyltransferase